jgi:hypothetical protein
MSSSPIMETESSVQLKLVEILTSQDDVETDETSLSGQDHDFNVVTGYLLSHSSSSIIVKLACQTLEKVACYSSDNDLDMLVQICFWPYSLRECFPDNFRAICRSLNLLFFYYVLLL